MLQKVILAGRPGGQGEMQAWKDQLGTEEVLAIIAWFQSLWPEPVYTAWSEASQRSEPLRPAQSIEASPPSARAFSDADTNGAISKETVGYDAQGTGGASD
jgi:hypothetical protein